MGIVAKARSRGRPAGIGLAVVLLAACAAPLSPRDPVTLRNLADLKIEVVDLVASFDGASPADVEGEVRAVDVRFRKALEYERGKGPPNDATVAQFGRILGLFREAVREHREEGPGTLGPLYFREAAAQIGRAIDIAVGTEALKDPAGGS